MCVGHHVGDARSGAPVDAHGAVDERRAALPLRAVQEPEGLVEVPRDVVAVVVVGFELVVVDRIAGVRRRLRVGARTLVAGAVEHVRNAEAAQQAQVLGVVLAADVDVRQQARRVALDARARFAGEDLAHAMHVLGVARRVVAPSLVHGAQVRHGPSARPAPAADRRARQFSAYIRTYIIGNGIVGI